MIKLQKGARFRSQDCRLQSQGLKVQCILHDGTQSLSHTGLHGFHEIVPWKIRSGSTLILNVTLHRRCVEGKIVLGQRIMKSSVVDLQSEKLPGMVF